MSAQDDVNMTVVSKIAALDVQVDRLEVEQGSQREKIDAIDGKLNALVHEVKLIRFALIGIATALAANVPALDRFISKFF